MFVSMLKTPMSVLFSNLQRVAMAGFEGAASAALLSGAAPGSGCRQAQLGCCSARLQQLLHSLARLLHSLANSFLPSPSSPSLGKQC